MDMEEVFEDMDETMGQRRIKFRLVDSAMFSDFSGTYPVETHPSLPSSLPSPLPPSFPTFYFSRSFIREVDSTLALLDMQMGASPAPTVKPMPGRRSSLNNPHPPPSLPPSLPPFLTGEWRLQYYSRMRTACEKEEWTYRYETSKTCRKESQRGRERRPQEKGRL